MSDFLDDLSPKQESHLSELKIVLSDVLEKKHDDRLLLQFLRARCFDLKKSEDMFRKYLEWRKRYPEDYIEFDYKTSDLMKQYVGVPFLGFDKDDSPIRLIPLSKMDIIGITSSFRLSELKQFVVWCLDTDKRSTKLNNAKTGKYVETRTFIIDFENVTLRQITHKPVLGVIGSFLKLYEANYPENLKVAYVINVPYFFAWLFNLVKTVLSEETIKKIKIFGKDGWKEEMLKLIDPERLPVVYGGSKTDPNGDPNCSSIMGDKGPMPEYHYLKNQKKLNKDDDEVRQVTVSRRDKKEVEICVIDSGSTIIWDVESFDNDLYVSIVYKYKIKDVPKEEILHSTRFGGDYGPNCGNYMCKRKGVYALILDNTFSLLRSKQVLYRINVIPPLSATTGSIQELNELQ